MKKESIYKTILAGAGLILGPGVLWAAPEEKPNIIHIMADDLGWRDLSIYGSETYQTPNIDRLATLGIRFSNAYSSSPLCSPSRAAVLTGQSVGRLKFTTPSGHEAEAILDPKESESSSPGLPMTIPQSRTRLPLESVTISRVLKEQGYQTAFLGKWHLGRDPHLPENFAFDVVIGGRGTPGPPAPGYFGPWPNANLPDVAGHPNVDDVLGDEAAKYIATHKDKPFFMALWFYHVHAPFQAKPDEVEGFRPTAAAAKYQRSAVMASMIKTLDDNVGRVLDELEKQGLTKKTIVIFTSDNGGNIHNRTEGEAPTSNHPLRAGKGNGYEGGVRVPLIVSWPEKIAPNSTTDAVNIGYDFFPTVLDVLGLSASKDWQLDGKSALPAWRGESFERGPIYIHFPHTVPATGNIADTAVRDGKWKLLRFFHAGRNQQDEYELYDLSKDIGETRNLAQLYPEVVERLSADLTRKLDETGALLARSNPSYNPDWERGGFRVADGGYLMGGNAQSANIIAKGPQQATIRYRVPEGAAGRELELELTSNCAEAVVGGVGVEPIWAQAIAVSPDSEKHTIRVPLGAEVSSQSLVTLVFDLRHAGNIRLEQAKLVKH